MDNFFNTIKAEGQMLLQFENTAEKQRGLVLSVFRSHKTERFTPAEIHAILQRLGHNILLTSVRRAITVLTNSGHLEKGGKDTMKAGNFGAPNFTWKFVEVYCLNEKK